MKKPSTAATVTRTFLVPFACKDCNKRSLTTHVNALQSIIDNSEAPSFENVKLNPQSTKAGWCAYKGKPTLAIQVGITELSVPGQKGFVRADSKNTQHLQIIDQLNLSPWLAPLDILAREKVKKVKKVKAATIIQRAVRRFLAKRKLATEQTPVPCATFAPTLALAPALALTPEAKSARAPANDRS